MIFRFLVFLSFVVRLYALSAYIDYGNPRMFCPTTGDPSRVHCSDGSKHFLCETDITPCADYKALPVNNRMITNFLQAHNGIRNKVAQDFRIANMNTVYWNRELSVMAVNYIKLCRIAKDPCLTIGTKIIKVNQNYRFHNTSGIHGIVGEGRLANMEPYIVRAWYIELGSKKTYDEFLHDRKNGNMENFTQLIMPTLEFIGCAGANYYKGAFFVCYYYPFFELADIQNNIIRGAPCTACDERRLICSKIFEGLCGVDRKLDKENESEGAMRLQLPEMGLLISCVLMFILVR